LHLDDLLTFLITSQFGLFFAFLLKQRDAVEMTSLTNQPHHVTRIIIINVVSHRIRVSNWPTLKAAVTSINTHLSTAFTGFLQATHQQTFPVHVGGTPLCKPAFDKPSFYKKFKLMFTRRAKDYSSSGSVV